MPDVSLGHIHVFVCGRSPQAHKLQVHCRERLVICPYCGAAGEMVRVELHVEH